MSMWFRVISHLQADLIRNGRTVSPRTTKFVIVWEVSYISGSTTPEPQGSGPYHSPILGVPFCVHTLSQNDKI